MPPKDDPELQKLRKELDDLMTKIKASLLAPYLLVTDGSDPGLCKYKSVALAPLKMGEMSSLHKLKSSYCACIYDF
jgi:hypothetical protein